MKPSELKKMMISSLDADDDQVKISSILEKEGITFDFSKGFSNKVLKRVFSERLTINREAEFISSMNYIFYRIAFTGVAAIIVLLISIFLMEGSLSFNSFLGLNDSYKESIVCLLTGN